MIIHNQIQAFECTIQHAWHLPCRPKSVLRDVSILNRYVLKAGSLDGLKVLVYGVIATAEILHTRQDKIHTNVI